MTHTTAKANRKRMEAEWPNRWGVGWAKIRRTFAVWLCFAVVGGSAVSAQQHAPWRLVADGDPVEWTPPRALSPDSIHAAAEQALTHFQREGYFLARIDSAAIVDGLPTLFATRGAGARIASVRFEGVQALDFAAFRQTMGTREGGRFDRAALEADLNDLLIRYERTGFPLAQARPSLTFGYADDGTPIVDLRVQVVEGETLMLVGVELDGETRTSDAFAARAAGLQPGLLLARYDPEAIRQGLEATRLFETIGTPTIALTDSGVVIRIPVTEGPPGTFDLLLGYLPGGAGRDGSFIGSGLLELRNLFGGGRQMRLRLVRNPGLVSSVDVRLTEPYVLGFPLQASVEFAGHNQDSTFSRQRYGVEAGYRIAPGLEVLATGSREFVQPGVFGAQIVNGRPRVAESSALFAGAGVRFRRIDQAINPRSGLLVEAILEQGFRRRTLPPSDSGLTEPVSLQQQRLIASGRVFLPTFSRQVLVVGGDAQMLLGGRTAGDDQRAIYDEGDLFRFGGATSLRGYDEDQFIGNIVGRFLAEYRYQLDRTSFAFLFVDVGYIDRPALADFEPAQDVKPGYGFGVQYQTPLGLVTVTYAVNPDLGIGQGKVHLGLSFGL
ncbi:MAG: BamA/TamA family outer membrane protein [Bacteroidetes bacterium]|nr:BamA/TamA family outer membrane protein [Bacteroidota bacterium]